MNDSPHEVLRQLRAVLRRDLQGQIELPQPDWRRIKTDSARLTLLDACSAQLSPRPRPPWVIPVAVALVSASIVLIASFIRPSPARVELDAVVSGFALTVGERAQTLGGALDARAGSVKADDPGRPIANDALQHVIGIDQIRLAPGTNLRVSALGDGCQQLRVVRGALAAQLTSGNHSGGVQSPGADLLALGVDGKLEFCPARKSRLYLSSARSLDISMILNESERPFWYGPSIVRGELRFPAAGSSSTLRATDRLSLGDIGPSHLAIELSLEQRLVFEGDLGSLAAFGFDGYQVGSGTDLRPTLLTMARSSPTVLKFFAAISGLSGLLLGARRWLSPKGS